MRADAFDGESGRPEERRQSFSVHGRTNNHTLKSADCVAVDSCHSS